MKFEILNVQEEDLADEALIALKAIAEKLSEGSASFDLRSDLNLYLRPIIKECTEQLEEPEHKQAKPASQILRAISSASIESFAIITKAILPKMHTIYQDASGFARRRALLELFLQFSDVALGFYGAWKSREPSPSVDNPLGPFRDRIFELFCQALMSSPKQEVSFRLVACKGILSLAKIRDFLSDSEFALAVQHLDEIILNEESIGGDLLKTESIRALAQISIAKPNVIMELSFPAFMAKLPDQDTDGSKEYLTILEGLAEISVETEIFETLIRRLLNKLDVALRSGSSPSYAQAILATITYALSKRDVKQYPNLPSLYQKIVVGLITRVVDSASGTETLTSLNDDTALDALGQLAALIVRSSSPETQSDVAQNIYKLYSTSEIFLSAIDNSSPTSSQSQTLILSTYLLAGLNLKTKLPFDTTTLLMQLVDRSSASPSPAIRLALLRQIAFLANKFHTPNAVDLLNTLFSSSPTPTSIPAITYLSKALLASLDPSTASILSRMTSLLSDTDLGPSTARGIALLLAQDPVLSKENGFATRLLSRQKVFTITVPLISSSHASASTETKPNHLIALSGLLPHVDATLILPFLPSLLPLLLQSLDLPGPASQAVKLSTLKTLGTILSTSPASIDSSHIPSLTSRLLKTASEEVVNTTTSIKNKKKPKANNEAVRIAALTCLRYVGTKGSAIDETVVRNLRRGVVRGLLVALDDPKRDVRKEAVDARTAWLAGDDGDEEDE